MIRESQEEQQQQLEFLRRSYEEDKKKLEVRVLEEKARADKRYNDLQDEYELRSSLLVRIQELESQLQDEEENHRDELQSLEIQIFNLNQQFQSEIEIKNNQIDINERTI